VKVRCEAEVKCPHLVLEQRFEIEMECPTFSRTMKCDS
jgi:hypothetical protein